MTIISRVQYEMENEKGEKIETEIWKVYTLRHYVSQLWNNNTVWVWGGGDNAPPLQGPSLWSVYITHR